MPKPIRVNKKVTDEDIIRLNSLGFSLSTIADELSCHPTTITLRLKSMGIEPADTRRTFMEDILKTFSPKHQKLLVDKLGPHYSIKDHVRNLLAKDLITPSQEN